MTRKFLEDLGIAKELIDKILDENSADIGKEIGKTKTAQEELGRVSGKLKSATETLEEMKRSSGDTAELQKQLKELQDKYTTDTTALQKQITDRDYTDAISKAIAAYKEQHKLSKVFSSKGAERDFVAALREKGLELKDGAITGFDDFIKAQKEADPDAFESDTPAPRFAGRIGAGGAPQPQPRKTTAEQIAEAIGKTSADTSKSANSIISMYTGGNKNGT